MPFGPIQGGGGGGGGAVDSVNGQTGVVVLTKASIGLGNVSNTSDATKNTATATLENKKVQIQDGSVSAPSLTFQSDLDTGIYTVGNGNLSIAADGVLRVTVDATGLTVNGDIAADNFPISGTANTFAGFDGAGDIQSVPGFTIDTTSGGMNEDKTQQPNNLTGGYSLNSTSLSFDPLQNSPNDTWNVENKQVYFDINDSGFTQGTTGQALNVNNLGVTHQGTGNVGNVTMTNNFLDIGNGTDPITIRGFQYATGFGNINANVTVSNQVQGYVFQPTFNAAATLNSDVTAFADFSDVNTTSKGHTSYFANPQIFNVANNSNAIAYQANPTIDTLTGNAGYTGLGVFPNITTVGSSGNIQGVNIGGTITTMTGGSNYNGVGVSPTIGVIPSSGSFNGANINPVITLNNNYVSGLTVNMNNVTNFAGVSASLVVQDITYTLNAVGTDGNNITVEYIDDVLAGSEVANFVSSLHIQVHIESGVSTATQVVAALNANSTIVLNATFPITGTASNAQVTFAETNLAGGINAGRKLAADLTGDVSIQGALSFTGGLSIGALSSFANVNITAYPSGVNSLDTLITQPTIDAAATVSGSDLLSVNTAMLLNIGAGATVTSTFLGYAALGLPAVVTMGAGATIDHVTGAAFAISLDDGAGGGTITDVDLCRAIAIPNGITTVTNLYGYKMDMPFGDVGTNKWGVYITPTINNWMAGALKIGGTDTPDAGTVLHVDGGMQFDGNLGYFGATPVIQQSSSGAQTAGVVYTATEQTMLQEAYDALRAYGLLS